MGNNGFRALALAWHAAEQEYLHAAGSPYTADVSVARDEKVEQLRQKFLAAVDALRLAAIGEAAKKRHSVLSEPK